LRTPTCQQKTVPNHDSLTPPHRQALGESRQFTFVTTPVVTLSELRPLLFISAALAIVSQLLLPASPATRTQLLNYISKREPATNPFRGPSTAYIRTDRNRSIYFSSLHRRPASLTTGAFHRSLGRVPHLLRPVTVDQGYR
jgi:hypothetical protein